MTNENSNHFDCIFSVVPVQPLTLRLSSLLDIVSRWQQLESDLLALQKEAQLIANLKTELLGIDAELGNLRREVEFDNKFDNIHQLEDALKTVKVSEGLACGRVCFNIYLKILIFLLITRSAHPYITCTRNCTFYPSLCCSPLHMCK